MVNQFNFLKPSSIMALELSVNILPSVERVELLTSVAQSTDFDLYTIHDGILKSDNPSNYRAGDLSKMAKQIKGLAWYSLSELPLMSHGQISISSSLFDELLKSVLVLNLSKPDGSNQDLFFIYFRKDSSEFGPISPENVFDTNQKMFVGRLIYNTLNAVIKQLDENREALSSYNQQINLMLIQYRRQLDEKENEIAVFHNKLSQIVLSMVDDIQGKSVKFTSAAIAYLWSNFTDLSQLKTQILEAVNFVLTLSFGSIGNEIVVDIHHFKPLDKPSEITHEKVNINSENSYDSHTKVYQFLDMLEKAAGFLIKRGEKITSTNMGGTLEQPITAAAISDKLKNHSRKIVLLLQQYPDKWATIRYHFKPLINIQERVAEEKLAG